MKLSGINIPVTTPFVNGQIAVDKLADNMEKWNEIDLDGYVIFGSSGETVYLSQNEKIELVKSAKANIPDGKLFIVGTGHESTNETIHFTKIVADIGAEAALVVTPNYYKNQMTADNLRNHYISVADKSAIPIILYNVPVFTGIDMTAQVIIELSNHPNIIGIKDSTNNFPKLINIIVNSPKEFKVLIGNAIHFLTGQFIGAHGAILAICNVAPQKCVDIYRLYQEGSYDEARQLFFSLVPLVTNIISQHGIPAIKAAMDMLGYFGGTPRPPLLPVNEKVQSEIRHYLKSADLC